MTDDEIRIAIAEACGFDFKKLRREWMLPEGNETIIRNFRLLDVPNYPNDLNAMHEAESHLFADQWDRFTVELERLTGADKDSEWATIKFKLAHATAPQRAEAFICARNINIVSP